MVSSKVVCLLALALFGSAAAQPAKDAFWKGTPMDGMVEEMRFGCAEGADPTACIKYKVMSLLDSIFKKDTFQVSDFLHTNNGNFTSLSSINFKFDFLLRSLTPLR